jgi:hypothetical protein
VCVGTKANPTAQGEHAAGIFFLVVIPSEASNLSAGLKPEKGEIPRREARLGMTTVLIFP